MEKRILVLNETFRMSTGGGITLYNLFSSVKGVLYNACTYDFYNSCDVPEKINQFYCYGKDEIKIKFPFKRIYRINRSFFIKGGEKKENQKTMPIYRNVKWYRKIYRFFYGYCFFDLLSREVHISNGFVQWIRDCNVNIVYAQVADYHTLLFLIELKQKTGIPMVLHIMDDWVSRYKHVNFVYNLVNRRFCELINSVDVLMTISDGMRDEYIDRYNTHSLVFHNTIDLDFWESNRKKDYDFFGEFKILYAGRIGPGTYYSLLEMSKAVHRINLKGINVKLYIQSPNIEDHITELIGLGNEIVINSLVEYSELPRVYSSYDLLILPIDFQSKGLNFLKYSMPTKVPEYCISGTPILVYAPSTVFLYKHANANKFAFCFDNIDTDIDKLDKFIIDDIILSKKNREKIAHKAYSYACEHYSRKNVSGEFNCELNNLLKK